MNKHSLWAALSLAALTVDAGQPGSPLTKSFQPGPAPLKSAGQLAFGPDGVLFVADARSAAVVAFDTDDREPAPAKAFHVEGVNSKLAGLLGTTVEDILIDDLAVNPVSHRAYLSVSRGRGPAAIPVVATVDAGGRVDVVEFEKLRFSRAALPDAPVDGLVGEGRRQSNPRLESITDIAFFDGRVLVAGLANEEFASTFRAIPFPFGSVENGTSVEIYHGAHGRYETRAPIRTFVPFKVGSEPALLAAYTCTPLVQLPLSGLQPGAKVAGKTIAELGNRNRPLDIIAYQKDGRDFLLLANSSRGVVKVNTDRIEEAAAITAPVPDGQTKGLTFETLADWKGVDHLATLDATRALVLRRAEGGGQHLEALPRP